MKAVRNKDDWPSGGFAHLSRSVYNPALRTWETLAERMPFWALTNEERLALDLPISKHKVIDAMPQNTFILISKNAVEHVEILNNLKLEFLKLFSGSQFGKKDWEVFLKRKGMYERYGQFCIVC